MLDADTHIGASGLEKNYFFTLLNFPDTSNLLSYCLFYKKSVLTSILN